MSRRTTRTVIEPLIGGVSQQPPGDRQVNQCEAQDNADASTSRGLGKRAPTEHIAVLDSLGNVDPATAQNKCDENSLVHWVEHADGSRYVVVVDNELGTRKTSSAPTVHPIKVFDLSDGTEMTVTGKDGLATPNVDYLFSQFNTRDELRAVNADGSTYLANRSVITAMTDDRTDLYDAGEGRLLPKSKRRTFFSLPTSAYWTTYKVRIHTRTGKHHPVLPDYLDPPVIPRKPTESTQFLQHVATAWVKTYNGDDSTGTRYGAADHDPPYNTGNHEKSGRQIWTADPQQVLEDLWAQPAETSHPVAPHITDIWQTYNGGIAAAYQTAKRIKDLGSLLTTEFRHSPRHAPAKPWEQWYPPLVATTMMLELLELSTYDHLFREELIVNVLDDGGSLVVFSDEIRSLDLLPDVCKVGHKVKVVGLEREEGEDASYWVEFRPNKPWNLADNRHLVQGYWDEAVGSNVQHKINADTMPMRLDRVFDPNVPNSYRFELVQPEWSDCEAGDGDTNPPPSFIGKAIQNIFFWRNRLGLLSGTDAFLSEAGNNDNFWRTSVRQVLDADPITLEGGHDQLGSLRDTAPADEVLLVFTDEGQMVVRGEGLLTPKTAGILPSTSYRSLGSARPEPAESGVFFAYSAGDGFSQVRELMPERGGERFRAIDSAQHVPSYVKGAATEISSSKVAPVLAVRTDDTDGTEIVYMHRWLDTDQGRVLNSWSRYLVGPSGLDAVTGHPFTKVVGMKFIGPDLYLLVHRFHDRTGGALEIQLCVEKLSLTSTRYPDVFPMTGDAALAANEGSFRCLLDRRITNQQLRVAATYDASTECIQFELPYERMSAASGNVPVVVITRPNTAAKNTYAEGTQLEVDHYEEFWTGTRTVTRVFVKDIDQSLWTDYQSGDLLLFFGQAYEMRYEFSELILREQRFTGGVGEVVAGRWQLKRAALAYEDSGAMQVRVSPALHQDGTPVVDRDPRVYDLPQLEAGLGRSHVGDVNIRDGVMQFLISTTPDKVRLEILNDTPYPCHPTSLTVEGTHTTKSRRNRV